MLSIFPSCYIEVSSSVPFDYCTHNCCSSIKLVNVEAVLHFLSHVFPYVPVVMSELIVDVPAHILHQPCTDRDPSMRQLFLGVSQRTTAAFKMLGRWLDVEETDLNAIEEENTGHNCAQERKYQASSRKLCFTLPVYISIQYTQVHIAHVHRDGSSCYTMVFTRSFFSLPSLNWRTGSAEVGEHARSECNRPVADRCSVLL